MTTATYRIQFRKEFPIREIAQYAQYMRDLGIGAIYSSPLLQSGKGSDHGYNGIDPRKIDSERGSLNELRETADLFRKNGMGWILDIVPNHSYFSDENPYLYDVMKHGQFSPYAYLFDINWHHPELKGKFLIPILGEDLHQCIEDGTVKIRYENGKLEVAYHERRYPLSFNSVPFVLALGDTSQLESRLMLLKEKSETNEHSDFSHLDFEKTIDKLQYWPPYDVSTLEESKICELNSCIETQLWHYYTNNSKVQTLVNSAIEFFNSKSVAAIEKFRVLMEQQAYQLDHWSSSVDKINYRRFFIENSLITYRMSDKKVFDFYHQLPLQLVKEGRITGVRIDHVDGLLYPLEYLKWLRSELPLTVPVYIEKILATGELFEDHYPTDGTFQGGTGYETLISINRIMVKNIPQFEEIWRSFTKETLPLDVIARESQYMVIDRDLAPFITLLARTGEAIAKLNRKFDMLHSNSIASALREFIANMGQYRTYIASSSDYQSNETATKKNISAIEKSIERSLNCSPQLRREITFLSTILMHPDHLVPESREQALNLLMDVQRLCSIVAAKGLEDRLFYVVTILLSLCEVGGDPIPEDLPLGEFHKQMYQRAKVWPQSLNTLSTHDTKRGEDVRARLNYLSELPEEWRSLLYHWSEINKEFCGVCVSGNSEVQAPSDQDQYMFYQTLIGSCPIRDETEDPTKSPEWEEWKVRVSNYMNKAVREAKVYTNWVAENRDYQNTLTEYVKKVLNNQNFLQSFLPVARRAAFFGLLNTLSQVALNTTLPGIPDLYQGSELWNLSLVDPDNRRPVDYQTRITLLQEIKNATKLGLIEALIKKWKEDPFSGKLKLLLIERILNARKHHDCFQGDYIPITATGSYQNSILSYLRQINEEKVLVTIPRFYASIVKEGQFPCGRDIWARTAVELPADCQNLRWKNLVTGETFSNDGPTMLIGDALKLFPIGILASVSGE
jgi:(1->4)-alpha-D-glucan 1-alpha-D-glucosylmutase